MFFSSSHLALVFKMQLTAQTLLMDCINGLENTAIFVKGTQIKNDKQKVKEPTTLGVEWIDLLKKQSADWTEKPLVVLSLFDGIGAIWEALSLIGIPFVGYSSEIDDELQNTILTHQGISIMFDLCLSDWVKIHWGSGVLIDSVFLTIERIPLNLDYLFYHLISEVH
eukprot:Gb_05512 [translate_table: standard]